MIRIRPRSQAVFALVFALSACSADSGGDGGTLAPTDRSTSTTLGSIHDGLNAPGFTTKDAIQKPAPVGSPAPSTAVASKGTNRATTTTPGESRTDTSTTTTAAANAPTTTTTTTTVPPGLPPEKCPDARTCRRYKFSSTTPVRWRVVEGRATIPFEINATGCGLSPAVMRQAMEDAVGPWEVAAPTVDFVFVGFTERAPVPQDGHNVVACVGGAMATPSEGNDGYMAEADMLLGTGNWTYSPCEQADNSCTPLRGDGSLNIASIATHEFGHWLWMGDMNNHSLDRELTMSPGDNKAMGERSRHWSTLALGDILGIRELYPCSCPLPPVYTP